MNYHEDVPKDFITGDGTIVMRPEDYNTIVHRAVLKETYSLQGQLYEAKKELTKLKNQLGNAALLSQASRPLLQKELTAANEMLRDKDIVINAHVETIKEKDAEIVQLLSECGSMQESLEILKRKASAAEGNAAKWELEFRLARNKYMDRETYLEELKDKILRAKVALNS